ncbi:MAG: Npt1/Npt2 family nucleotide transporter [Nitrospinota bacterium]
MARFLGNLFNVRREEWERLGLHFSLYFLLGVQFVLGLSTSESLFLAEVGPRFLPYMYILNAFLVIAVSSVYVMFADKVENGPLFVGVLACFLLALLGVRLLIALGIAAYGIPLAYPLLYSLYVAFTAIVVTHFGAFLSDYYDTLESKRLFPLIYSGARFGGILGGLSLPVALRLVGGADNLLLLWMGFLLAAMGVVVVAERRSAGRKLTQRPKGKKVKGGKLDNIAEGFRFLSTSPYLRVFALFTFLLVLMRYLLDYQYSVIFRQTFPAKDELAAFYGLFGGVGSALAMVIQIFFTPRLIQRFGVGTANLVYPFTTALSFLALTAHFGFYSAILGRFNKTSLQESIRNPLNTLMYNAIPANIRGRTRAFTAGFVVPAASVLAGLTLLPFRSPGAFFEPRYLAPIGVSLALLYILCAFRQKREYARALLRMLEERNFGLFRFASAGFGDIDQATFDRLVKNVREGDDESCALAANILAETAGPRAIPPLLEAVRLRTGPTGRELIRLLGQVGRDDERVRELCEECLDSPDPHIRAAAIEAVGESGNYSTFIDRIHERAFDSSPEVCASAIALMVADGDLFCAAVALQRIHAMLGDEDPASRMWALRAISRLKTKRFIKTVLPFLQDEDPAVRQAAAATVEALEDGVPPLEPALLPALRGCLADPSEEVRGSTIRTLGRLGTEEAVALLIAALSDRTYRVREEAVRALEMAGMAAVAGLEENLDHPWIEVRRQSSLVLGKVGGAELRRRLHEFSLRELRQAYLHVGALVGLREGGLETPWQMLAKSLRDYNHEVQVTVLKLLGVMGDERAVEVISKSLSFEDASLRANAIETLENVTSPDARRVVLLLEPLLSNLADEDRLEVGRKQLEVPRLGAEEALLLCARSRDKWIRATALHAAGAMSQAGRFPQPPAQFLSPLREGLADEDPYVREAAAEALVKLPGGDGDRRERLLRASEDPDARVARQAQRALRKLGDGGPQRPSTREDSDMLSTIEKVLFLKQVSLFASMRSEQLKIIGNICRDVQFPKGKVIFEEGDACDYVYIIVEGKVDIIISMGKRGESLLATLGPGRAFGEMAVFGDEPRSASAVVREDSTLLTIEKDHLLELIQHYPDLSVEIIKVLCDIIRAQDRRQSEEQAARQVGQGPGAAP